MNDCTTWREELLEAAPDELAGAAPTALADHVRECLRCGDAARLLLTEQARLGGALSLVQPRVSADAAAAEILSSSGSVRSLQDSGRDRIQRFAAAFFPMAAAAGLAMYVVYGRGDATPRPLGADEPPVTRVRITAPPGTSTVVLTTSDPTITFAWIGREATP